jgi:undecaprenyl-diphosphatase
MAPWFAALLGLIQGLTEFLPISSTAHLRIAPTLLGQPDPGAAFSAVIQLGTLVAVIGYFARDLLWSIPRAMLLAPRSDEARRGLYLIVGTVPIAVCGVLFEEFITGAARSLYLVASMLALLGVVMYLVDRRGDGRRGEANLRWSDVLILGCAQALALVPGVSRSGVTITTALLLGIRRSDAARFSFLLGVPAIAGAGLFELPDALAALEGDYLALLLGTFTSAVSGYLTIAWLLRYLGRSNLAPFAVYRVLLALLLLALCAAGVVDPGA